eukprot:Selendium_serpulae@DN11324_c0_g1_i1.p1
MGRVLDGEFLKGDFAVNGFNYCMKIRKIPGDGNCLFTSVAAAAWFSSHLTHPRLTDSNFKDFVIHLRHTAIECLADASRPLLHLEGDEVIERSVLLTAAAVSAGSASEKEYIRSMRESGSWGGGPELVGLSNALERPIFLYEVDRVFSSVKPDSERQRNAQWAPASPRGGGSIRSFFANLFNSPRSSDRQTDSPSRDAAPSTARLKAASSSSSTPRPGRAADVFVGPNNASGGGTHSPRALSPPTTTAGRTAASTPALSAPSSSSSSCSSSSSPSSSSSSS